MPPWTAAARRRSSTPARRPRRRLPNAIDVPAGSAGTWQLTQRGGQTGAVTGAGTLTLQVNYVRGDLSGDWSAYTGQVNVLRTRTGTNVDDFRINATTRFGTAAINLGPYVQASTELNASNAFTIGELSSSDATGQLAGIIYNNNTPGSYAATYVVGARNINATFAGSIVNGTSPSTTAITKIGTGTWVLAGTCPYTGATTVNGGVLEITGAVTKMTALTVASGSVLYLAGGQCVVAGAITNNGTVRLSGAATISSTGTFTNNGVLDLINGTSGLPTHVVNNGTVLDASSVRVRQTSVSGANFIVTIQGYQGHTYQLQRSASLTVAAWTNVGASQAGGQPVDLHGLFRRQHHVRVLPRRRFVTLRACEGRDRPPDDAVGRLPAHTLFWEQDRPEPARS